MLSRRLVVQLIGVMFGASKSYQVRAATVSFGTDKRTPRFKHDAGWQQLHLATSKYLTVTASINGTSISAIIDTGATRSVVNVACAQRLRLPTSGTLSAAALTGQVNGTLYRVRTLGLGDVVVHNIDVSSFDVSAIEGSLSRELPLVVGQDLLASAILEVEFPKDRARLSASLDPKRVEGFVKLPVAWGKSNLPHIPVDIEDGLRSEAIVDLGSDVLCSISESFAREHGLFDSRPTSTTMTIGVEGPSISRIFSLRTLRFGPYVLHDVPACGVSNWNFSQPINLGWPCFSAFDFLLDTKAAALWLAASPERLKQAIPRDRSGIGAARLPDRLVVRHVAVNSPAAHAGLRGGDEIIAIDGRAVDADYPSPSERQGEKPAGTRIDITLADGRALTVILADYF
jgi:hypothetical protein